MKIMTLEARDLQIMINRGSAICQLDRKDVGLALRGQLDAGSDSRPAASLRRRSLFHRQSHGFSCFIAHNDLNVNASSAITRGLALRPYLAAFAFRTYSSSLAHTDLHKYPSVAQHRFNRDSFLAQSHLPWPKCT
jgi:hypothetical protein